MNLLPYPEYKDSGVEWLGEVPSHWKVHGIKFSGRTVSGTGFPHVFQGQSNEEYPFHKVNALAQATANGVIDVRNDTVSVEVAEHLRAEILPGGSIVMAKIGAALLLGRIRILGSAACIDNNMLGVMIEDAAHTRFAYYSLQKIDFELLVNPGAVPSLSERNFRSFQLAWPSLDEQRAIADFLDHETAEIDAFIADQNELIGLLNERRAATITQAVTKGLDPNVPMKDSGIEWLGEIPEHWKVNRLGRCAQINAGQVDPRYAPYDSMLLVAPNHIESGTGKLIGLETAADQGADSGKYLVRASQVIYSKIRPNLMKTVIAPVDCLCSADMYGLEADASQLSNEFLKALLLSRPFHDYAVDQSARVAMPKLNHETLKASPLWLPPVEEQQEIVDYLNLELPEIDAAVADAKEAIKLSKERRAALISAAVTGKIDVRDHASAEGQA